MKSTSLVYGSLLAAAVMAGIPGASAAPLMSAAALCVAADEMQLDVDVRAGRGGGGRVGGARGSVPRVRACGGARVGGAAVRRTAVVGGVGGAAAVRRGGVAVGRGGVAVGRGGVVRTGAWVRPGYRWGRGGAIAAGAALGFVAAGTAAAWAGSAPCPNCCWYYTDPSRTAGIWDYCP